MRLACIAALSILLWSASSRADEGGPFGLGIIVGAPTGLTGELQLSDHTALDGALGFDVFHDRDLYFHLEFLYFLPELVHNESISLAAYLGIGGYVVTHKDTEIGARAPFGLSLQFNVPLELFVELPIYLSLAPGVDIGVWGAGGFRYYF